MIRIRLTRGEIDALEWDRLSDFHIRPPSAVKSSKMWTHYDATLDEWQAVARYASAQSEALAMADAIDGSSDSKKCARAAVRILSALAHARGGRA
jgi:hypothetical protein